MMESVSLPHIPGSGIVIGLFRDVSNAGFLRQQLLDGNAEFEYAFLDTALIASRQHVLAACFRALHDHQQQRMKTRNAHSEIVFCMSPNNNIAESFRRFGISDATKHIVAVKIGADPDVVQQHLQKQIRGEQCTFADHELNPLHDLARIRKVYRIESGARRDTLDQDEQAVILGSMALRGS